MRIKWQYIIFIIVLVALSAFILAFGQSIGFSDVVKSGISSTIIALAIVYLTFAYEEGKTEKEKRENAKQALKAISSEMHFNLKEMGEATEDTNNPQFAPDKMIKVSLNGIASAGFFSLLNVEQQQFIFGAYRKLNRIEMWSDYGMLLLVSEQPKSMEILGFVSKQSAILRNELRVDIKTLLPKLDGWIKDLEK